MTALMVIGMTSAVKCVLVGLYASVYVTHIVLRWILNWNK